MQRTATFDKAFITTIKDQLIKDAAALETELAEVTEIPAVGTSEDDAVLEVEVAIEHQSLRTKLMHLLTGVRRALRLIEEGTFGICQSCQATIERARLQAMPAAITCVSCSAKRHR